MADFLYFVEEPVPVAKRVSKAVQRHFARFSELREAARLIKSKHLVDLRQRVVQDFYPGALLLIQRKLNQS
jgi:hypothetical protein